MGGASSHLIDAARTCGLLTEDHLATLVAEGPAGDAPVEDTAQWLVERGIFTPFQAEEALAGRVAELVLAGRYRLEARLGAGATGTVYRAHDSVADRTVAVKVLPAQTLTDPSTIARFRREAKALSRLSHPSIVEAYDADQDGDRHFLAMEYVEGEDLEHAISAKGRIPPTEAAGYAYQAALGLAHAHERGLVHRDMKPANLLVTPKGRLKILDLGLARFLQDTISEPGLTREGMGLGTPDYVAPEQFRDAHAADARSDIYSLGCTLYHALTGRVPFPGTSLGEKLAAHEREEPQALEAFCPDCPAGLALVVRRMMAKKPQERFASAVEVAQALGVFVAASSIALPEVHATAMWQGSQVVLSKAPPKPRRRAIALAGAAVVVAASSFAAARFWTRPAADERAPSSTAGATEPALAKEGVLTVAQDGSGRYRTVTQALEAATPGATIRILDDATYVEALRLDVSTRHEGITLEAPRRATIVAPPQGQPTPILPGAAIYIDVPRVTVRGLRFRGASSAAEPFVVDAGARASGVRLEGLDVTCKGTASGIILTCVGGPAAAAPAMVIGCRVRDGMVGISVTGQLAAETGVGPILVQGNRVEACGKGISLAGPLHDVQVVGNIVFDRGEMAGIQLQNLGGITRDLLVANNTVMGSAGRGVRVWDDDIVGARIEVRGNVLLAFRTRPDMGFLDSGGDTAKLRGPGDGSLVPLRWAFGRNWREAVRPTTPFDARAWIPPTADDVLCDEIAVLSRDPKDDDFLRPAADSPLATGGVGADGLPRYAGAVAPKGAEPWDWATTWEVRQARVVTVSADPKDHGQHRTIASALAAVRPGGIVRIVDAATYKEDVEISQGSLHAGVTIEATGGAWIEAATRGIRIVGVPGVSLRHLRVRGGTDASVLVWQGCPGTVLSDLDLVGMGISVDRVRLDVGDAPVVVERCRIRNAPSGLGVAGCADSPYRTPQPCGRVIVRQNRIENCTKGLCVRGAAYDVLVVGNVVWGGGSFAGIEIQNLLPGARDILVANNTVFETTGVALRIWDEAIRGDRVEVRDNLLLGYAPDKLDWIFVDNGGEVLTARGPGDGSAVGSRWTLGRNWREARKPGAAEAEWARAWVVPAPDDALRDAIPVLSRDSTSADFLRPAADSPLGTGGGGSEGLPGYVGALPPLGTPAWAWEQTWMVRAPRLLTVSADPKGGGQFRTLGEALAACAPRATIRILDAADYPEIIALQSPSRHEGVTLEAPLGARLVRPTASPKDVFAAVSVRDVRNVTLRGLRVQGGGAEILVSAFGAVHGLSIEGLDLQGTADVDGIQIDRVPEVPGAPPVVVKSCRVRVGLVGVSILGYASRSPVDGHLKPATCSGVRLRGNRLEECGKGILVAGACRDVQVVGNVVTEGGQWAGIELQRLLPGARGIVVANNTIYGALLGIRVWDETIRGESVTLRANLTLGFLERSDWSFAVVGDDTSMVPRGAGDPSLLAARWNVDRNWREARPPTVGDDAAVKGWVPPTPADTLRDSIPVLSRSAASDDFLRPAADSPLATGGVDADGLPPFVGAVEPKGSAAWDWSNAPKGDGK